jgi:hypothetical protein
MARTKPLYSVHPGIAMVQSVIAKMKDKTGRSIEEWIAFAKKSGPATEEKRRDWLKKEHELGTNYAWWIAERCSGKGAEDGDPQSYLRAAVKYVEAMYAGKKAALKPIYDELLDFGLSLGDDVKACPCQTMVPLYRQHVFAQIKPTTNTRVDLGLCLRERKVPKRAIPTGGLQKGDRITHRIEILNTDDFDDEAKRILKLAYAQDA